MSIIDKLVIYKEILKKIAVIAEELERGDYTGAIQDTVILVNILKKFINPAIPADYIHDKLYQLLKKYLEHNITEEEVRDKIIKMIRWASQQLHQWIHQWI